MSQTRSTLLTLAALTVAAAGVGLYAWRGVYTTDQAEAEARAQRLALLSARPSGAQKTSSDAGTAPLEFARLTVTLEDQVTVLEKDADGTWNLVEPVSARADQAVVTGLLSQLRAARFKSVIDEHPDQAALKTFGLDRPRFSVQALVAGESEARTLKLEGGLENTFDGSSFVRRDGQDPVYSAEGALRYALAKTTFDLRDKQVLALEEAQLKRLAVKAQGGGWTLERDDRGRWALTRPFADLAEPSQVSSLLSACNGERAQAFPADAKGLMPLFAHPAVEALASLKDGTTVHLALARPPGDAGDRWYALREDADGRVVAEVGPSADHFERPAAELKDRSVMRFEREAVGRIALHSAAGEVLLVREASDAGADTWEVAAPRAGKARSFKVTAILWTMQGLKANPWGEEHPRDWGRYGVDARSRWLSLQDASGTELARLTLGKPGPAPGTVYVRGTQPQVARVESARLDELPFAVADVLDEPVDGGP
jgi:Domain of unknown function (DUF4340)